MTAPLAATTATEIAAIIKIRIIDGELVISSENVPLMLSAKYEAVILVVPPPDGV